jgi:hypothetical protein
MEQVEISSMWRILPGESGIALILSVFMIQSVLLILDSRPHCIIQVDCTFSSAFLNMVTIFKG